MPQPVHTTFGALSDVDFVAHATAMINNSRTAAKKREAIAYLQSVCSTDKNSIETERKVINTKRLGQKKRQDKIASMLAELEFDFQQTPELFTAQSVISDADMITALTENSKTIFVGGKQFSGAVIISGSNVTLDGEGSGSAKAESLSNTAVFAGDLILSGDKITVRNIDFTSSTNAAVRVSGASNVTLENCRFAPGTNLTDTKWFYGAGLQTGDLTIKNCFVQNFDSWMLMDASTTSAAATVRLDQVRIKNNFFKNNAGSIAIRGPESDPNKSVIVTGNRFETTTFHQYFWDFLEVSGGVKKVRIEKNVCIGAVGTHTAAGKKGGFQIWSKSDRPWTLYFKDNSGQNLKVFLKIAHNAGFYSPNTFDDENHRIEFDGTLTDVAFAFSPVYKKADGTTLSENKWQEGDYVPENVATYPSVPNTINTTGYPVVSPS